MFPIFQGQNKYFFIFLRKILLEHFARWIFEFENVVIYLYIIGKGV